MASIFNIFMFILGGIQTHQDGAQFEDALRRLHALEKKLTGQVGNVARQVKGRAINKWHVYC